jgi:hypothetical protein
MHGSGAGVSSATVERGTGESHPPARSRAWWVVAGLVPCAALWLWSLTQVDVDGMAGWGLLDVLPLTWYLALAGTLAVYAATLIFLRPLVRTVVLCQGLLVAILFATTSVLYSTPRYFSTYKHVGVVEYLVENGWPDRSIDIYQNFPGFFAVVGVLHRVTTIPVQDLAQWAQPSFAVLNSMAVYWLAASLSRSRVVCHGAVLLFTLGDWLGQNYFAPQAAVFPVCLFVLGGLIRSAPRGAHGVRWERLGRGTAGSDPSTLPRASAFWTSWWGAVVLVLAFTSVAVSHQISPLILIVQSIVVSVVLRPARPLLPVAFVLIELAWLASAWPFLSTRFSLLDFDVANVAPPESSTAAALPGFATAQWAAPLLIATIGLLAAGAVVRAFLRGRGRVAVTSAAVAVLPAVLVFAQAYGNEGIFRMYLFALPWAAFMISSEFFRPVERPVGPVRAGVAAVVLAVLAALLLPACFSAELANRVHRSDLAAQVWFEENAPPGTTITPLAVAHPLWTTASYPQHLPTQDLGFSALTQAPGFAQAVQDPAQVLRLARVTCLQRAAGTGESYVAVGPTARAYLRLFGYLSPDQYEDLVSRMDADPFFTVAYREGDSVLYRCTGQPDPAGPP